ncbi:MAG: hypothetical protein GF400_05825 [Candidatus Eisenbacteria bacterium]|nr:hypothetical protein [Candidatus Eisenbacteria bacterium]
MPEDRLTLTVSLKTPDNEARSALEALRVKMGLGATVSGLDREDVWEFGLADGGRCVGDIKRVVESTNLFANPNKHRCAFKPGAASDVTLGANQLDILVSDRERAESESILSSLRRLGVRGVVDARHWVRWRVTLEFSLAPSKPDLSSLIGSIAVANAREGGLFCNPHIERATAVLPWGEEKALAR